MLDARKTIIVVDDDKTNLTAARNALLESHNVLTTASGKNLFGILEKVVPDLILLDVLMPDMDGYDVIKILKSNAKTADIPVLFLSAQSDNESEVKGLELGAADYIFKPFSRELLIRRVEMHLLMQQQTLELKRYSSPTLI